MKNVLIFLELIPEAVQMFMVTTDSEEVLKIFRTAHGHFVNGDNTEEQDYATDVVNLMLGQRTDSDLEWAHERGIPHEYVGMYSNCMIDTDKAIEPVEKIDMVIRTGFYL